MNEAVLTPEPDVFDSASDLREGHARLLELLDRQVGQDGSAKAEAAAVTRLARPIRQFLTRGVAVGVYLEEVRVRTACQILLDYWVSTLVRAGIEAPPSRLTPFNGDQLPDLADKPCPYVGLAPFRTPKFFFGRELDTQKLLDQIRREPLVVVVGASGSGKSSLLMGGVLSTLAAGTDGTSTLRVLPIVAPGTALLERLAAALEESVTESASAAATAARVRADAGYLTELVNRGGGDATLIAIDQFEEVFTLADVTERDAIAAALAALLGADARHRVVLTMREEFRSRLVELRPLTPFLENAWYSMRPMGYEELADAVQRPADLVNLQFHAGVVDDLVRKVLGQPAALPLLQFTLRALWDGRDRNRVTWEVYRRVGDPLTALQTSADTFYDSQAPQTQAEIRRLLLELVRVDELLEAYRRPMMMSRLLQAGKADTADVLGLLVRHDYVQLTANGDDAIAEVKHESLIRNWPRLVEWIDRKRVEQRQRIGFTQAARNWADRGRPSDGLLRRPQLDEAARLSDLSDMERAFVDESAHQLDRERQAKEHVLRQETQRLQRRTRRIWTTTLVVVAALLSMTILLWRLNGEARDAERTARVALSDALTQTGMQLAARAQEGEALAYLTRALRIDPASITAMSWISDILLNRHVWVPIASLRHRADVASAAFSPDSTAAVTVAFDNTARLWDVATGDELAAMKHDGPVVAAAFSPDGRSMVTASADHTARVWNLATGRQIGMPLQHADLVNAVAFSPDGLRIVTASGDGTARVWDASSGQPVGPALQHQRAVYDAAFSPDGRRVVTGSDDKTARIWDALTGQPIGAPLQHLDGVTTARFSPDGRRIVTASFDHNARIWDALSGRLAASPLQHFAAVTAAAFSPDGRRVVTASTDDTARVWDAVTAQPIGSPLQHSGDVYTAVFSTDGRRVVTASEDQTARVWDAITAQPLGGSLRHAAKVTAAAFSPDGEFVITTSADHTARLWNDVAGHWPRISLLQDNEVVAATFSPDGTRVITASKDSTAVVWNAVGGQRLGLPLRHRATVTAASFSPDGRRVLTASVDHSARLWDATTNQPIAELRHDGNVSTAVFSPSGDRVATASDDRTARVWDGATGAPIGKPLTHTEIVTGAGFSPDGRTVLTLSAEGGVRLWNAATGQPIGMPLNHLDRVRAAAFSPDGTRIVTASDDKTARVWDAVTGRAAGAPLEHVGGVTAAAFSPDGRFIVTGSTDRTARVWSAVTLQPVGAPLEHLAGVSVVAFSPDSRRVVTTAESVARVWDAATGRPGGAPLQHAGTVYTAEFSPDGRRVVTASADRGRIWDVWLHPSTADTVRPVLDAAEVVGGYRLTESGSIVPLSDSERLPRVRRLAGGEASAFVPLGLLLRSLTGSAK